MNNISFKTNFQIQNVFCRLRILKLRLWLILCQCVHMLNISFWTILTFWHILDWFVFNFIFIIIIIIHINNLFNFICNYICIQRQSLFLSVSHVYLTASAGFLGWLFAWFKSDPYHLLLLGTYFDFTWGVRFWYLHILNIIVILFLLIITISLFFELWHTPYHSRLAHISRMLRFINITEIIPKLLFSLVLNTLILRLICY